jgi:hypothetical protein
VDFSVYICWITNSKVFYNYYSFSQSSTVLVFCDSFSHCSTNVGFWLLVSISKTMLTVPHPLLVLYGRF